LKCEITTEDYISRSGKINKHQMVFNYYVANFESSKFMETINNTADLNHLIDFNKYWDSVWKNTKDIYLLIKAKTISFD
jgi:hypothetical protein